MVRTVGIVSLSSGILGESFVEHEVKIGLEQLHSMGIQVKFMPNSRKGLTYLKNHPEARAQDLLDAFCDDTIDMILCAIGGDDTYRLLPYLFDNNALEKVLSPKIFLGFSDTTMNHFMLHKLGLPTFYGQAFLPDVCELEGKMLPYSEHFFSELVKTGKISEIIPSDVWYEERKDFSEKAVGTKRIAHKNTGFELLQGTPRFSGKILGGCIDTIFDIFDNTRYSDSAALCSQYHLFPSVDDWKGKILLLETSEEQPAPEKYHEMLLKLKETGIFNVISGILCGKPMDEKYTSEYKKILTEVVDNPAMPIVFNLNIGHATPRCIIPLGVEAFVDAESMRISFH